MTFLSPMPALIAAAISVPILVALYLLKLRRRPLRVSSTMLWEQAVKDLQANVPLRWLRPSLLFFLQLLALACLLIALARPALPSDQPTGDRLIIAIDASASMSATDGVPPRSGVGAFAAAPPRVISPIEASPAYTRLDQARDRAQALIDEWSRRSGPKPPVMIVELASQARALTDFTDIPSRLREAIDNVQPTDQPGDLAPVIKLAGALTLGIDSDQDTPPRVDLVIITGGGLDATSVDPSLPARVVARIEPVGPATSAELLSSPAAMPDNIGIVALSAKRDLDEPALIRVFARIHNAGPAPITTTVVCQYAGETATTRTITIPAAKQGPSPSEPAMPGEASLTLELERPGPGLVVVAIPRTDRLASDNQAGVFVTGVRPVRVLVVGPGAAGAQSDRFASARGEQGVDRFLLSALAGMSLGQVQVTDAQSYDQAPPTPARFDVVIFDRVQPRALPAVPSLSIGAGLPVAGHTVSTFGDDVLERVSQGVRFAVWKRTHPVLRYAPLDSVLIAPPLRLVLPENTTALDAATASDARAWSVDVLAEAIVPLENGAASTPLIAAFEGPRGSRRLVLAFDLLRTNWGSAVSFPVFFASAIEYLSGATDAGGLSGVARSTLDPVAVRPIEGASAINLLGPVSRGIGIEAGVNLVELGVLPRAGVYTADGASQDDRLLAISLLSPRASGLVASDQLPLGVATGVTLGPEASRSRSAAKPRGYREVWHWFVLTAGVLLMAEWFIFARQMRV
jgi:Aerotolerance regulator N-terminal/von Willebrand factor type A domain